MLSPETSRSFSSVSKGETKLSFLRRMVAHEIMPKHTSNSQVAPPTRPFRRRARPCSLARLLKARDFDQIRQILSNQSFNSVPWIQRRTGFFGETSLHLLFKVAPPVDVVDAIIAKLLESELSNTTDDLDSYFTASDCTGWTPIHIAIAFGCGFDMVSRLFALLTPETAWVLASTRDGYGRFPLHWACLPHLNCRSVSKEDLPSTERLAIIQLITDIYPAAVAACDHKGFTPLEYAASVVGDEAVSFLKKTRALVDDIEELNCDDDNYSFSFHDQFIEISKADDEISVITLPDEFDDL